MIDGEKDILDDLALLGVEGFDSGSENSQSEEATTCTGSWAKAGTDGGTFPMEAGNTDNSKTADLGWKPKHMRSWNGCKWGRGWHSHHRDADSLSRHQSKHLHFSKDDWRHHWRSWEYPSSSMHVWIQSTGFRGRSDSEWRAEMCVGVRRDGDWLQLGFL